MAVLRLCGTHMTLLKCVAHPKKRKVRKKKHKKRSLSVGTDRKVGLATDSSKSPTLGSGVQLESLETHFWTTLTQVGWGHSIVSARG